MKLTNESFLKAKRDKQLNSMLVIQREENRPSFEGGRAVYTYIRLCLNVKIKFSDKRELVFVETPTEIKIENYSGYGNSAEKKEIKNICFHCDVWNFSQPNHIQTFLNAITAKSDVSFRLVAYNGNDYYKETGQVAHQLYGIIDNKQYFLSYYVGKPNTAAPVNGGI